MGTSDLIHHELRVLGTICKAPEIVRPQQVIHEEDGRTVIANLHTLDTARHYCDRVIGMLHGRVVFDGTPEQLTTGVARDIYGANEGFSEASTSTSIETLDRHAQDAIRAAEAAV